MPAPERVARMRRLRRAVAGHDVFVWASEILTNLERLGRDRLDFRGPPHSRGAARRPRTDRPHARPRSARLMPDSPDAIASDLARRRDARPLLLLLDFDGTLAEFNPDPTAVYLDEGRRDLSRGWRGVVV